jgi:microcystin-dependent protein
MPISVDATYLAGTTGGSATTTLITANLPSHTHSFSATTGTMNSNTSHNHQMGAKDSTANEGGDITTEFVKDYPNSTNPTSSTVNIDHTHSVSGTTGGTGSGTAATTISPYIAVYMWNRTV